MMNDEYDPQQDSGMGPEPQPEGGRPDNGSSDDGMQRKVVYILAYLFGILFFLPLLLYPNEAEARFHANQSLLILLCAVIGEVVFGILCLIPVVGILFGILCGLLGLAVLVACIYCIVGVAKGECWELPVLGKFRLIR